MVEDKFFSDELDPETYKNAKGRYGQKKNDLIMDITLLQALDRNLNKYMKYGLSLISHLEDHS